MADEPSEQCYELTDDDGVLRRRMRVTRVEPGWVTLAADRAAACGKCAARTGCGAGTMTEMIGGSHVVRLPHNTALPIGEEVTVAMEGRAFLGAAFRAYLLPPMALAGSAAAGLTVGLSDAASAGLSMAALAMSFLPLLRLDRRLGGRTGLWIESDGPT